MTTAVHRLSGAVLGRLAAGLGGAEAIRELRRSQLSKHLLLIRFLLERQGAAGEQARDLLERARSADPDGFAAVAGAPMVGGWTAIAGRAAMRGEATAADLGHISAIAIVAAARTGVDGSVAVPVHHGLAMLPGLGAIEAGDAASVRVSAAGGRLFVLTAGGVVEVPAERGWLPVRRLTADAAGQAIDLALDDLHPYRHGHHVPPANRLPDEEVDRWRAVFAEAWVLLATRSPERAGELGAGLQSLVPLVQTDPRSARSATIRHAFGVFGLTRPPTAADFAVTLVHEFQHSKLSAVLHLARLTDPADERRYFAPWRTDPRPLPGLLQGVYAFAGVADTWLALRDAEAIATRRFAETRLQVDRGLTSIEESGSLTPAGEEFVAALRITADRLLAEPVPADVDRDALAALARTHAAWADRNGR
ncbi:HEXXH motif domain-containing protein [Actinoplanes sp. NPDC026623]|uniref:HEXXH motif domain-containing protein n=1 Tax=Actinoplanes sp. NPDC026623 TaxID=3155610 RepID=UPI0033DD8AF3